MARANLKAKTNHKRVNDELGIYGGEREVECLNLIVKERVAFDYQSLVLSYFRSHSNLDRAAKQCGIAIHEIHKWERENIFGFAGRVKLAKSSIAARLHAGVIRRIDTGEIKNPTLIRDTLKLLDPDTFDPLKTKPDGGLLDQLRKERQKDQERMDMAVAQGVQEQLEKLGIDPKDPEAPAKAKKLLRLQKEHHNGDS